MGTRFRDAFLKEKENNKGNSFSEYFNSGENKTSYTKGNSFREYFGITKKEITMPEVPIIEENKDKSFFDRVKEFGASFTSGIPSLIGTVKAGIGNYLDSIGKTDTTGSGVPVITTVEDKIGLYTTLKKDLETALKENKTFAFRDGKTTPSDFRILGLGLQKVNLSNEDKLKYEAQLAEVNTELEKLKIEDANTVTISEKLKESAKQDFKKSEEERLQVLKKFGEEKKWSGQWIANEVATNSPQFLASFGLGVLTMAVTKNPVAALSVGFSSSYLQESGGAYEEAISSGATESQAQKIGNSVGLTNAFIEQIPLGRVLNKIPEGKQIKQSILKNITKSLISKSKQGILEGSTESVQEMVGNAYAKSYDENRSLFANVPESFTISGVLGVGGDVTADVTGRVTSKENPIIDPKVVERANEYIKKAINTPEAKRTQAQTDVVNAYIENKASNVTKVTKPSQNLNGEVSAVSEMSTTPTTRKLIKVEGLPETVTGKSVVIRPDGTASYNLEVAETARGKGVGANAVKIIENAIVENGATKIELPVKEESVGFFEKQGYTQVGEVKSGLVTMTKDLTVDTSKAFEVEQSIRNNVANIQQDFMDGKIDAETRKRLADEQFSRSVADKVIKPIEEKVTTKTIEENITNNEKEIRRVYSENKDSVDQALYEVYAEMDVAQPGFRTFNDGEVSGVSSTFPKWIPEHLRSKKLFDKVMGGLVNIEDIKYPSGNRPKQRELYDTILGVIDQQVGVDTSKYRNDILNLYEQTKTAEKVTTKPKKETSGGTSRGVQPTEKEVVKVPSRQLPVGEGKEKLSRLQARVRGVLDTATVADAEELGLATFRQMNQDSNIAKAAEFVANNPEDALKVIMGEIDPPQGVLSNSVLIALKEAGAENTELGLKVASLAATRSGQEISILRNLQPNNPVTQMENIIKTRIEAFEKRTGKSVKEKVSQEIKKIDAEIKAPSARQWDSFLASIRC